MKHTEIHGATKVVEVTVRLVVKADADVQEVVSEMDYTFDHPAIVDTEVIEHEEKT